MMKNTYYNDVLNQYLIDIDFYENKDKCMEYSDGSNYNSMGDLFQSQITLLLWGKKPSNKMFDNVCLLNIEPPEECLYPEDIPSFIKDFHRLKALSMPLVYGLALQNDTLPESVEHLSFINDLDQTDNLGNSKKEQVQNLLFPNIFFPNIKSLNLVTSSTASIVADGYLNINESHFPRLEFLRCVTGYKDKFPLLENFTNLRHLWVSINKTADIFKQIKSPIVSLNIDGTGSDFKIQEISKISSLEIVRINSCCNQIDCNEFLKLPNLKEIILLNSKEIKNIESLLEMPTLKSLDVLDCKDAFTKQQKKLFQSLSNKFERLSIDYA